MSTINDDQGVPLEDESGQQMYDETGPPPSITGLALAYGGYVRVQGTDGETSMFPAQF